MFLSTMPASLFIPLWLCAVTLQAQQTLTLDPAATSIVAAGSSTFHDWEMPLQDGRCRGSATFSFDDNGLAKLTALSVQVEAEGLQSNKKGMNKRITGHLGCAFMPDSQFKNTQYRQNRENTQGKSHVSEYLFKSS